MGVIKSTYRGDFQVEVEHCDSGKKFLTDLPVDNAGKGRTFSPTDLFASSLASCILTIMAKVANRDGVNLAGTQIEVTKHMQEAPRKVKKLVCDVFFSDQLSKEQKAKYLSCVKACPVHKSLNSDIEVVINCD